MTNDERRMTNKVPKNQSLCPRTEIAVYLDGELGAAAELDLEQHLANCPMCLAELNKQKKLLSALDLALESDDEIRVPDNFAKVVTANAESKVKGLRCPSERNRAFWVCAGLLLMILFGLGAETSKTFAMVSTLAEKVLVVGSFFTHLIWDMTVALSVILRSLCLQFVYKSAITLGLLGLIFFLSVLIFSRLLQRQNRF